MRSAKLCGVRLALSRWVVLYQGAALGGFGCVVSWWFEIVCVVTCVSQYSVHISLVLFWVFCLLGVWCWVECQV